MTSIARVAGTSAAVLSNFYTAVVSKDIAAARQYLDTDFTIRDVKGPDGTVRREMPVAIFMVAVRKDGRWGVRVERAHFL